MANITIGQIATVATTAQEAIYEIEQSGVSKQLSHSTLVSTFMVRAEWRADTHAGYGSTDTKIPYFTNVRANVDTLSAMTVVNNSTNGCKVTINLAGNYTITYYAYPSSASNIGISVNSSQLTTNIVSIDAEFRRAMAQCPSADSAVAVSWTGWLAINDVIRPHAEGVGTGAASRAGFTIAKVS